VKSRYHKHNLDIIHSYCATWKLTVSLGNTKCWIS